MPEGPAQEEIIQHRFTWNFADGTVLSDAIVMPKSQFNALTNVQLKTLKQNRAQAYKDTIDAARAYRPTDAELKAQRRERRAQLLLERDQVLSELIIVDKEISEEVG